MNDKQAEFDRLSASYEELLADPIRDRFSSTGSQFFHVRKRDLIREYFRERQIATGTLKYLDLGCGKGELLTLLRGDFAEVAGCDPSVGMMQAGGLERQGIRTRVQTDHGKIPFDDASFDFVTAVCVYHHIPPPERSRMTAEIHRVLKPGGLFAILEHNPYNPATQWIVRHTPVDDDAILLAYSETGDLLRNGGFRVNHVEYFLYLPEGLYGRVGRVESWFKWLPLGGQYAAFGSKLA